MMEDVAIVGRKTFFIAPDRSLVTDFVWKGLCPTDTSHTSFPMTVYVRFNGLTVNFNGLPITSDAVLIMKHSRSGVNCGIFMFVKEDGSPELETAQKELLNKKIYSILTAGRRSEMDRAFASV